MPVALQNWGLRVAAVLVALNACPEVRGPDFHPLLVDGHVHITNRVYWEYRSLETPEYWRLGLCRARQGGVNVVIENVAPYGYSTYNTTIKQVGRLIETFHGVIEANSDKMEIALSASDARRIVESGKLAIVLGIESGFDQEGDLDILRLWYRRGVRLIQFSSQVTNSYADSSIRGEPRWSGINDRGRRLIAEMNRLDILIDITHATEAGQRQIIEASKAPVVASHVGIQAICSNPANMSDDMLRALSAKGGLVGIHSNAAVISQRYYDWQHTHPASVPDIVRAELELVRSPNHDYGEYIAAIDAKMGSLWRLLYGQLWPEAAEAGPLVPTAEDWIAHVEHAVAVAGRTNVGIGLDLTTGRSTLKNLDARGYPELVDAVRKHKFQTKYSWC